MHSPSFAGEGEPVAGMSYARSGDAYIAYEVDGEGPIDLLLVTEGFVSIDMMYEEPHLSRVLRRLRRSLRGLLD